MEEIHSEVTWEKEEEEKEEEEQAQVDIWKYIFGVAEFSVVRCAIELGIADAIEKHKKPMSLIELSTTLKCDPSYLNRIMRFLVHRKIFKTIHNNHDTYPSYVQTPLSRRLIKNGEKSMAALFLVQSSPVMVAPWLSLSGRVLINGNPSFEKVHGEDVWGYGASHLDHSNLFNDAMACDAKIVVPAIVEGCSEVFDGVGSLVDVGGGNGTAMSILAKAFPWIHGINFDLPHVIEVAPKCHGVEHVAGDMFTSVPKADAVIIKVVAQKLKEAGITEQDSLLLTRNLLRIAIFNISYIRGLFPEKYFNDKSVPALEMKIKKLLPVDAESRRLIDWMEKGVYDALQKKYLKTLLFCVCEAVDGPMIEEYAFSFSYSDSEKQEVSMNINRTGSKKQGSFKCNSTTEITPQQMRSSACKMIRTLVQLMRTLEKMPEERTILMKLLYYDDVTPADYEPPFFRGCSEEEANHPWVKNPLKMEVGNVNSKHFVLALKVKSVLDPCEDDNEGIQDDMSDDSMHNNEYYDTDSEVDHSQGNHYFVAPIEKQQEQEDTGEIDEENTQDPVEDEQQLVRVKEWLNCCHLDTIDLTDVLSNFPDISVVLTEEIMDNLVKEGVLSKIGKDTYTIITDKKSEYDFTTVKEEIDGQMPPVLDRALPAEDLIYMKALYHTLPMAYVSVTKLQSSFQGEVSQAAARKLLDRMTQDGFVEPKGSKRLGKRVIHSELTEKKLIEVQKALGVAEAMDVDHCEPNSKSKQSGYRINGSNRDISTCGVLHSIGSDLTRMKVTSDTNNTDSMSGLKTLKAKETGNTPTSRVGPVASRESFAHGKENSTANGNGIGNEGDAAETIICSKPSQEKRPRKTSAVKEPIHQNAKRQRSQAP